jgi:membrane protease YdiL (CAAX protease family)
MQNKRLVSRATYRQTSKRLGWVLVLFSALFLGLELATEGFSDALPKNMTWDAELLVIGLVEGLSYLISFLIPAGLLLRLTPRGERFPLLLEVHWPRRVYLILPAGLAVIHTAAVANDFLMRCFGWTTVGTSVPFWVAGMPVYEVILLFLTSAIIPAFCEELLFRGVVLSVLRPYGRTVAILGSAVLFSLMHQRADQLLYAAVAGAVLAYITLESRSVFGAMLLHLLNQLQKSN